MSQNTFGMKFKDPKSATWEDDKLDRKKYAEQLTQLVKRMNKPFVMTLSAPWGSGKTFFLNAWKNEIAWDGEENADKIPCVYFSAWEYDCVDDPLLAIVGKMQEELNKVLAVEKTNLTAAEREVENKRNKERKNMLIKLGKVARAVATKENLSKWGLKLLNKTVMKTVGENLDDFVEQGGFGEDFTKEDLQEFLKDVKNAIGTSPEKKLQAVLKEKESFIATVKDIVSECQKKLGKDYPILIMIDELDRCRPDYVISLLERIKNLFEVNGIFFVLAIDREQLYSVVEHSFGVKKTDERDNRAIYLQKFVNMDFELYKPEMYNYVNFCLQRNNLLFYQHSRVFITHYQSLLPAFANDLYYLYEVNGKNSIREFERVLEKFSILVKCYYLSSIEALIIWTTLLDSKPIVYLFSENVYEYTENCYNNELNFIDNFISNFYNWYITDYDFSQKIQRARRMEGVCCLLLGYYVGEKGIRANKLQDIISDAESRIEAHKFNFRKIISMAQSMRFE